MIFYCDASFPLPVAQALSTVRGDVTYPGHPECPIADPGTADEIWLPIAGNGNWVVLLRDKRIRSRPGERAALVRHRLRAFCLTTSGNATRWEILTLVVRQWPAIERTAEAEPGPYIYAVTSDGLRRIALS